MNQSSSSAVLSPRVPMWVWVGLLLLHALALSWQITHHNHIFPDSRRYIQAAHNLLQAETLYTRPLSAQPLQLQEYSIRPPAYPVFLLLTGGWGNSFPLGALLVQNLLSLLNLGLVFRWVARATANLSTARWLALLTLVALAPGQFIYANVVMSEMLLQTAVVLLALALLAFWQKPSGLQLYFALAAGAAAVALLIKPVFFPFAGVFLLMGLGAAVLQKRSELALLGAVPLVVALLWMARNEARTGYFHFSSIAGINLLRYNIRGVLQATEGPEAAEAFVRQTVETSTEFTGFKAQQQYIQRQSLGKLGQHPVAYAGQHVRGMINFFLDPGRFDIVQFLRLPQATSQGGLLQQLNKHGYGGVLNYLQQLPLVWLSWLMLIAGMNVMRLGLAVRFLFGRYSLVHRLVLGGLIGYVAFLTGPLGAARFAVPVLPLLFAAAALGLQKQAAPTI
ncbi:hypothetical protein GCM10027346_15320 [Hymenobacter seoulensis]